MARPKRLSPTVQKPLRLDGDLVAQVELMLINPETGKVKYGAFPTLVEKLLREWLDNQRKRGITHVNT